MLYFIKALTFLDPCANINCAGDARCIAGECYCGDKVCRGSSNVCVSGVCMCGVYGECLTSSPTPACLDTDTGEAAVVGDTDSAVICGVLISTVFYCI